ncbi:MAG: sensor histidine kinase [Pararhizobium sp.]
MRVSSISFTSLAARADRIVDHWISPAVDDEEERVRQTRLLRTAAGGAALAVLCLPAALLPSLGPATALAIALAGCAICLLLAAALSLSGSRLRTGVLALVLATSVLTLLCGVTGGLASPYGAWLAMPALEAALFGRSPRWAATGAAAALAGAGLAGVFALAVQPLPASPFAHAAGLLAFLCYAGMRIAAAVHPEPPVVEPGERERHDLTMLDNLAGLVTVHDQRGHVISVRGADAAKAEWLVRPIGRGFLNQIHVADRIAFLQAIDAIRNGAPHAEAELRMERPSIVPGGDQFVHLHVDFSAAPNDEGESLIVAQSRDVSAEMALRQAAARKADAAESANAAKSRFLAAVSHELRTPLNAILGFSDVLAQEYFGRLTNDRQREYVELIRTSGSHLLAVVNTMLDMSKIEAGRYEIIAESFDVAGAVAACESMLALQAEQKGVALVSRVARGCGEVVADRRAIQQILINLVANAIKFTEQGGVVTVDAGMRGDRFILSVSDTGIGIAADELETIGQPFVQAQGGTARAYEGSGLGLSLVKGLVSLHGGSFAIESKLGQGTVVTVELARDGSDARRANQPAKPQMVEFPPRLSGAALMERNMEGCDDAQARTA